MHSAVVDTGKEQRLLTPQPKPLHGRRHDSCRAAVLRSSAAWKTCHNIREAFCTVVKRSDTNEAPLLSLHAALIVVKEVWNHNCAVGAR